MLHQGATIWLTGMSGAGKSTLANRLHDHLSVRPYGGWPWSREAPRVEILDGDVLRKTLCKDLGFTKQDRDTNVERIGFLAHKLAKHGVLVIVAAISPYRSARDEVRMRHAKDDIPFYEILVSADMDTLLKRDTKGLYRSAMAGRLKNMTGIDDPYEAPVNPEMEIMTDAMSIDAGLTHVVNDLVRLEIINPRYDIAVPHMGAPS